VIPVSEADLLRTAFTAQGLRSTDHMVYTYTLGAHNALTLLGSIDRAREFLGRLSR
jgi:hypothetical protein